MRLAPTAARVLPFDVHDVGVIEHGHLCGQAGPAGQLAHRGAADLAHGELVQVRIAELRHAEVQSPAVALGRGRDEPAVLEHFEQIGHARTRRAEHLRELARGEAVLAALDEEHEQVEGPTSGASDRATFPHGA